MSILLLIANTFVKTHYNLDRESHQLTLLAQIIFLLTTTIILIFLSNSSISSGPLIRNVDGTKILKEIILFSSILAAVPIITAARWQLFECNEIQCLYLLTVALVLILVSSDDFLTVYLALEGQLICNFVFVATSRQSAVNIQSGLKYFLLNSIVSSVFIFFLSMLYGVAGTLNHSMLMSIFNILPLEQNELNTLAYFILIGLMFSIFFKLGFGFFIFWIPEVYTGMPLFATIISSIVYNIALVDLLIRISRYFFPLMEIYPKLHFLICIFFLLGIILSSILNLKEEKIKKFIVISSLAQIGLPLILIGTGCEENSYFFVTVYTFTAILFWCIYLILFVFVGSGYKNNTKTFLVLNDLIGLNSYNSGLAFFILVCLLSIGGLPPFLGFFSKYSIINALMFSNYYVFLIVLINIISLLPFYYYIKIIKMMFFEKVLNENHFIDNKLTSPDTFLVLTTYVAVITFLIIISSILYLDTWFMFCQLIVSTHLR